MNKENRYPSGVRKGGVFLFLLLYLLMTHPSPGYANEIPDPKRFYDTYGKEAIFLPRTETDGMICFGTRGARGGAEHIHFSTLGWKMTFADESGKTLQELFFQVDGSYLQRMKQIEETDAYYSLYGVTLHTLEDRLSEPTRIALQEGRAYLWLDGCMALDIPGTGLSGKMDDDGIISGTVYTSYNTIVQAQSWSEGARESLKGYFHKQVKGLFCELQLESGEGVLSVSGAGHYLYGQKAEIDAKLEPNYLWQGWKGSLPVEEKHSVLVMNQNRSLRAEVKSNFAPVFRGTTSYHSLNCLRDGRESPEEILFSFCFWDQEDGLLKVDNPQVSVEGIEHLEQLVKNFKEGEVVLSFTAEDSDGNRTKGQATVYLVDTTTKTGSAIRGQIRFLSDKYFEKADGSAVPPQEGGLMENSIWISHPDYRERLRNELVSSSGTGSGRRR